MQKLLQRTHALHHAVRRWRDEPCVPRTRATDPHLAAAELARCLVTSTPTSKEHAVDLAQQPERKREPAPEPLDPVAQCGYVVRYLAHVFERDAGRLIALVEEEIGEGRLRAFDLRGDQRLLADVGIDEERGVRQQRGHTVELPERPVGLFEEGLVGGSQLQRRLRRQRNRHEGLESLVTAADSHDLSCRPLHDPLGSGTLNKASIPEPYSTTL